MTEALSQYAQYIYAERTEGPARARAVLEILTREATKATAGAAIIDTDARAQLLAVRLAVIFHHARRPIRVPRIGVVLGRRTRLAIPQRWLAEHPLTAHLLDKEFGEWTEAGYPIQRSG